MLSTLFLISFAIPSTSEISILIASKAGSELKSPDSISLILALNLLISASLVSSVIFSPINNSPSFINDPCSKLPSLKLGPVFIWSNIFIEASGYQFSPPTGPVYPKTLSST